jgi:hypothetical protein
MTEAEAIEKATERVDWRNRLPPKRVLATFHENLKRRRSGWLVSFEFDVPWDPNILFVEVYDPGDEVVVRPMI